MSSYAISNLKQVENMAQKFGFGDHFEARFARRELECERTGLCYQRLAPNAIGPFGHVHEQDEEIYVVLAGSGRIRLDDEEVEISAYDAIRVAPRTLRAFAAGPEGLELLAFGTHTENDASMREVQWS
jgi:mannose-6-phosphate isomerase-like protein (cupin superfamily)